VTTPLTLAIDAATYTGTVALVAGCDVVSEREVAMRGEREERLMPAVADALSAAGATVADLGRVVCGGGPGSFTSLRIATAIAKGIATARQVPLYEAPSLLLMVAGSPLAGPGRYLAVLDAMRGEAFVAAYEVEPGGEIVDLAPAEIVPRDEVRAMAARLGARAIGPAEELAAIPRARGVARLAQRLERVGPVGLDAWEPLYGRLAEAQVKWEQAHGRPLPRV
jgi:tRNA threonylcarbamoyladenosine biosynthesis protein TsaB